ncbi:unnamed protein product, partial [Darwinula stevensoni]
LSDVSTKCLRAQELIYEVSFDRRPTPMDVHEAELIGHKHQRISASGRDYQCLGKSWGQNQQSITFFSEPNCEGEYITQNCPDISQCVPNVGDNAISCACVIGIWILYSEPFYNSQGFGTVEWWFGLGYCWNLGPTDNQVSSLRSAGLKTNFMANTITLYYHLLFMGEEYIDITDLPDVPMNDVNSIIITGESDWTVYTLPNFLGASACLSVQAGTFVGFYTDLSDLEINSVRSFREGCFSDTKIQPRPQRQGVVVSDSE